MNRKKLKEVLRVLELETNIPNRKYFEIPILKEKKEIGRIKRIPGPDRILWAICIELNSNESKKLMSLTRLTWKKEKNQITSRGQPIGWIMPIDKRYRISINLPETKVGKTKPKVKTVKEPKTKEIEFVTIEGAFLAIEVDYPKTTSEKSKIYVDENGKLWEVFFESLPRNITALYGKEMEFTTLEKIPDNWKLITS